MEAIKATGYKYMPVGEHLMGDTTDNIVFGKVYRGVQGLGGV